MHRFELMTETSVVAGALAFALAALWSDGSMAADKNAAKATGPAQAAASDNGAPKSKVWTYNPSGRAFKGGVPASGGSDKIATFAFPVSPDTALLVTDHGSYKDVLLGDLTGKTVNAKVSDSGGTFTYYGQPDACGRPANVRLYFQTKSPASFSETDYWWSNPVSRPLGSTTATTLSAKLDPDKWSDYNGHFGSNPVYTAAFNDAVKNVTSIGLSFGGGCFFENGVGAPNGGSFTLWTFSAD
jgi:hypothetical protein